MVCGASVGPVMIHSADTIRYVNDAFCSLVGVESPAAVTGRSPDEFVADPDPDPLADHFNGLRHDDTTVNGISVELTRPDGTRIDAATVSSPVTWDGETLIQTSVMSVDGAKPGRPMSLKMPTVAESAGGQQSSPSYGRHL